MVSKNIQIFLGGLLSSLENLLNLASIGLIEGLLGETFNLESWLPLLSTLNLRSILLAVGSSILAFNLPILGLTRAVGLGLGAAILAWFKVDPTIPLTYTAVTTVSSILGYTYKRKSSSPP